MMCFYYSHIVATRSKRLSYHPNAVALMVTLPPPLMDSRAFFIILGICGLLSGYKGQYEGTRSGDRLWLW